MTNVEAPPFRGRQVVGHGSGLTPIVLAALLGSLISLAVAMQVSDFDVWAAFLIAPVLVLLTVPFAVHASTREGDPAVGRFLMWASLLKIAGGTAARYVMVYDFYGGTSDAERYHEAGIELAGQLRHGDFSDLGQISGTRAIEVLTGGVYALIGPSRLGGFLVYSWLSLLGLFFFYFAFQEAFPDGNRRRCRLLLFLLPSLIFWPSSIGKDAVMVFALGLATFGVAKLFNGRPVGLILFGAGAWVAAVVRPHLTLILLVAFACALLIRLVPRRRSEQTSQLTPFKLLLVIGVVLGSIFLVMPAVETQFGLDRLDVDSADYVLNETDRLTDQGGSSFDASNPRDLGGYLAGSVTVLFRPFPHETDDLPTASSSAECIAFLVLCIVLFRSIRWAVRESLRYPFAAFCVAYILLFCFAFGSVANFGILCRQRVQLWPFLAIVLSAAPKVLPQRRPQQATYVRPPEPPVAAPSSVSPRRGAGRASGAI